MSDQKHFPFGGKETIAAFTYSKKQNIIFAASNMTSPQWWASVTPWWGVFLERSGWWSLSSCQPLKRSAGGGTLIAAHPPSAQMAFCGGLLLEPQTQSSSTMTNREHISIIYLSLLKLNHTQNHHQTDLTQAAAMLLMTLKINNIVQLCS